MAAYRQARFIITRRDFEAYCSDSPLTSDRMETLADFAKKYGGEVWVPDSHFGRVHAKVQDDAVLSGYLKELFRDGAELAGSASFESEEADMMFLAALLYSSDRARPLVLVHETPDKIHASPMPTLFLQLKAIGIGSFGWQAISLDDLLSQIGGDAEWSAYRESLSS